MKNKITQQHIRDFGSFETDRLGSIQFRCWANIVIGSITYEGFGGSNQSAKNAKDQAIRAVQDDYFYQKKQC